MLTVQEIESACDGPDPITLPRHEIEAPPLPLRERFYPYGYPVDVRTNSALVNDAMDAIWGQFEPEHDTEPLRCDVQLVESAALECPPEPTYRLMLPLMQCVADRDNYSIADLEHGRAMITISQAALRHGLYAQYFLLGTAVCCVATRHATPIHAACVSLDGCGMLLCGESGAGKSTLAYACARAGWCYTSDDASYLYNGGSGTQVTGNCHQVRFRPSAAALFPELVGRDITPRAAGKPSIELSTAAMKGVTTRQTTAVDHIIFLRRGASDRPSLSPYRKEVARIFMRQMLYGSAATLAAQYAAIERLLAADVFELRYTGLDEAVERLRQLASEGR